MDRTHRRRTFKTDKRRCGFDRRKGRYRHVDRNPGMDRALATLTRCLTLFTGYGRRIVGRVGEGTGFDIRPLIVSNTATQRTSIPVHKTRHHQQVVTTQHHQMMEGRASPGGGSVRRLSFAQLDNPPFAHPPNPRRAIRFIRTGPTKVAGTGVTDRLDGMCWLFSMCDCLPGRKQHSSCWQRTSRSQPAHALDASRHILLWLAGRNPNKR